MKKALTLVVAIGSAPSSNSLLKISMQPLSTANMSTVCPSFMTNKP